MLLFLSGKTNARNMATNLHLNHTIIFGILTLYYIVRKIQYCAYPAQQWTRAHWHIKHTNKIETKRKPPSSLVLFALQRTKTDLRINFLRQCYDVSRRVQLHGVNFIHSTRCNYHICTLCMFVFANNRNQHQFFEAL